MRFVLLLACAFVARATDPNTTQSCPYDHNVHSKYVPHDFCPDVILEAAGAHAASFHGCPPFEQRRCVTRTPDNFIEPQNRRDYRHNPPEENVRLNQVGAKYSNFAQLANRQNADCVTCWQFQEEKMRWNKFLSFIEKVSGVSFGDGGPIRTALDFGCGSGGFLSALADRGIVGLGFARNWNGLPYLETAAARGVLAMHFDFRMHVPMAPGAVDLVHCSYLMNILRTREELEAILYEWDRLVRPGGVIVQHGFRANNQEAYESALRIIADTADLMQWTRMYWRPGKVLTFVYRKPLRRRNLGLIVGG